jgi:hypothetical protein
MNKVNFNNHIDYENYSDNALANYGDIINTYESSQKDLAYKYLKARKLRRKGYKLVDISRFLNIPSQTIYGWNISKGNPYSLNCVKSLLNLDLLPLISQNTEKFKIILKLFAYILTDGNISQSFANITICGELEDLESLSEDIIKNFPTARFSIVSKNTRGILEGRAINGVIDYLQINSVALGRLLYVLGAPKGDKVKQIINLPKWIFNLDDDLKKVFLGVLWSAEGSKPIRTTRGKYIGGYNLYFTMAKDIRLMKHHIKFLNQIRLLFKEFGIETTEVKLGTTKTKRKDGIISQNCYFYIRSNYKNFIRFYEKIPVFARKKKEKFDEAYPYFKGIAKRKQKRDELKQKVLNKANELFSLGYSTKSTAEKIGIPRSTLRYWLEEYN